MLSLLDPRIWLVALLVFGGATGVAYWKGRHDGKVLVHNQWAASTAKANVESFAVTEHRQRNVDASLEATAARARADRDRANRADRTISGLRDTLDATERHAQESLTAAAATVAAYRAVFGSCVAEYRAMGEEAAGHARDALMYRDAWPK